MKNWTRQAEQRLAEYLDARVRREGLEGADARELREDLTAHVQEEVGREERAAVGAAEVERVLLGMGGGEETEKPGGRGWLIAGGVGMPAGVAVFEMLSGFCGGVFFDPVPTFWHGLLVLLVPVLNALLLWKGAKLGSTVQGLMAGLAVVIAGFYGLLFLPLVPASLFALIAFGMGLLSLTPVIAWLASWRISRRRAGRVAEPWSYRRGWRIGAGVALGALLLLEGPGTWTRWHLNGALSENPADARAALARLRSYYSERTLLRACYEGNRGTSMGTDISGWIGKGWRLPLSMLGFDRIPDWDSEKVRNVFFRATGKPFNSLKPPRMVLENPLMSGRGVGREGFEFDDHLGGDEVAVRLKDLDLVESRFDGHLDGLSQIGYGEWTMVFRNRSGQAKEARCQVRLPRGGRVSRLTLWVNGEPREAAFSSVEKVKSAYRSVAVVQRKDPVLVTTAGPDTVMVQCFPVPAHGEMKIRFGVTAPLDGARWELPRVVERNFGVAEGVEQALWLQADRAFEVGGGGGIAGSKKDGEGFSTHGVLPFARVLERPLAVTLGEVAEVPETVWCEDGFAEAGERYLQRKPLMEMRRPVDKLVVVVDGSASMAGEAWRIQQALANVAAVGSVEVILADDGSRRLGPGELAGRDFSGGRDNEPALMEAISRAKEGESGAVVWFHGPQAAELSKSERLLQLLERGTRRPKIHEVEMVAGPNRLVAELGKAGVLERGPAMMDSDEGLAGFIEGLLQGGPAVGWEWSRTAAAPEGKPVWNHLARIWAIERSESDEPQRARIAATYQLVTPVSGAVVLETLEQFKEHGLTPVDLAATPSIPGVPEPSSALLVMVGLGTALLRRRREPPEGRPV